MALYVIAASPLVRIYLTEWHDAILENPDLIYDMGDSKNPESYFWFDVPRGSTCWKARFNKPVQVRGKDDKEVETLYNWLIGESGNSRHETDPYGLVPFDPGVDLVERQDHIAEMQGDLMSDDPDVVARAQKEIAKIQKDTQQRLKGMREAVREMADVRVRRAMKNSHNNLVKQWQLNDEMKMGKHRPSVAEAVGAFALDKELKAAAAKGAKIYGNINKIMSATGGG